MATQPRKRAGQTAAAQTVPPEMPAAGTTAASATPPETAGAPLMVAETTPLETAEAPTAAAQTTPPEMAEAPATAAPTTPPETAEVPATVAETTSSETVEAPPAPVAQTAAADPSSPDTLVPGMPGMKPNIMSDMMATHRRNIEALAAATRLEFEGAQALARRNTEIMRQAMAELADAITAMACAMTPDAKMAKRAELTKVAYERTVANIKELHDLIRKVNAEALDLLNRRFSEGMDEVKALIRQSGERRHP